MNLNQKAENESTNYQANSLTINNNNGLTYEQVHQIALDVFKSNFYDLIGEAKEIAKQRAEEITDKFLTKLHEEYPTGLQQANTPDFQNSLFNVQKEYAKCGDKELGDLLVDLLVDRSKQEHRNILQIVLNESLLTAPKLTEQQIAILSTIFIFKYTQNFGIGNDQMLGDYLDRNIKALNNKLVKNLSSFQHLEYAGCGTISISEISLEKIFGATYQGLFLKGFQKQEIDDKKLIIGLDPDFFINCLNDLTKMQVSAISQEALEKQFKNKNICRDDQEKIKQLFNENKMSEEEIKNKVISIRAYMKNIFDIWNESAMKNFQLTSVGIAIAHANIKKNIGEFANLAIWIN